MGHRVSTEVRGVSCDGEPRKAARVPHHQSVLPVVNVTHWPLSGRWKCSPSQSGWGYVAGATAVDTHTAVQFSVLYCMSVVP